MRLPVAGVLDIDLNASGEGLQDGAWRDVDVAIDFTTQKPWSRTCHATPLWGSAPS
jgi:hypothetical protein